MAVTFFSLPPEVRCQVYGYVFAGAHSIYDFYEELSNYAPPPPRRNSFTVSTKGELGFLLVSKQCYADAVDSYHEARTVSIRSLDKQGLEDFGALDHVHRTAKTVELDDFHIDDLSKFPRFPKLQRLVLNGVKMWGGNVIVERGQDAMECFDEKNALTRLFGHVSYSSLRIEEQISHYFPNAHIVINFWLGNQVMDLNVTTLRGVQDWAWACSYDVKTRNLEKRLARRLSLW